MVCGKSHLLTVSRSKFALLYFTDSARFIFKWGWVKVFSMAWNSSVLWNHYNLGCQNLYDRVGFRIPTVQILHLPLHWPFNKSNSYFRAIASFDVRRPAASDQGWSAVGRHWLINCRHNQRSNMWGWDNGDASPVFARTILLVVLLFSGCPLWQHSVRIITLWWFFLFLILLNTYGHLMKAIILLN
jgi:hypothetical protein